MSKEIKVALLAVVTLLVAYWGYEFIRGKNLFSRTNQYFVEYSDVSGLKPSSAVTIRGVNKGRVADFQNDPNEPKVLVTLEMDPGLRIPRNAVARIVTDGFMGGKYITLVYEGPCSGTDCAEPGDFLQGENLGLLASAIDPTELKTTLESVSVELRGLVRTIKSDLLEDRDSSTLARALANFETTSESLSRITGRTDRLFARQESSLDSTIQGLGSLGASLDRNSENIDSIFENLTLLSRQLGKADLGKTLDSVDLAITNLNSTLRGADASVANLKDILSGLKDGEGTLGKLLTDDELYFQLADLGAQIDSFLLDIEGRPYRYIPFKSRRKVKKYDKKDAKEEGGQ